MVNGVILRSSFNEHVGHQLLGFHDFVHLIGFKKGPWNCYIRNLLEAKHLQIWGLKVVVPSVVGSVVSFWTDFILQVLYQFSYTTRCSHGIFLVKLCINPKTDAQPWEHVIQQNNYYSSISWANFGGGFLRILVGCNSPHSLRQKLGGSSISTRCHPVALGRVRFSRKDGEVMKKFPSPGSCMDSCV